MDKGCEGQLIRILSKIKQRPQDPKLYSVCFRNVATANEFLYVGVHWTLEDAIEKGKIEAQKHFAFLPAVPPQSWSPIMYNPLKMEDLLNELVIGQVETYTKNDERTMGG
jgi:hypothetical protein